MKEMFCTLDSTGVEKPKSHRTTEYSEWEGTHKDNQDQLLSEWPIRGSNPKIKHILKFVWFLISHRSNYLQWINIYNLYFDKSTLKFLFHCYISDIFGCSTQKLTINKIIDSRWPCKGKENGNLYRTRSTSESTSELFDEKNILL